MKRKKIQGGFDGYPRISIDIYGRRKKSENLVERNLCNIKGQFENNIKQLSLTYS